MSETHTPIKVINGVAYFVDDIKAAGQDEAICMLESSKNIYWIVSRQPDEEERPFFQPCLDNVKRAFILGEDKKGIETWLDNFGAPYQRSSTLEAAVLEAHALIQEHRGAPGGAGNMILTSSSDERISSYRELVDALARQVDAPQADQE